MADDDRMERVARALCAADGHDPDERVGADGDDLLEAEFGISMAGPNWARYLGEARRFIAAAVAMGLTE